MKLSNAIENGEEYELPAAVRTPADPHTSTSSAGVLSFAGLINRDSAGLFSTTRCC